MRQCLLFVRENEGRYRMNGQIYSYNSGRENFVVPQQRLKITNNSLLANAEKMCNHLPVQMRGLPYNRFRFTVQGFLVKMCPYNLTEYFVF